MNGGVPLFVTMQDFSYPGPVTAARHAFLTAFTAPVSPAPYFCLSVCRSAYSVSLSRSVSFSFSLEKSAHTVTSDQSWKFRSFKKKIEENASDPKFRGAAIASPAGEARPRQAPAAPNGKACACACVCVSFSPGSHGDGLRMGAVFL